MRRYQCAICGYITEAAEFVDALNRHQKANPSCNSTVWHDPDSPTYHDVPEYAGRTQ